MDYKLVADSSLEMCKNLENEDIEIIPFNILIDGIDYKDDQTLDYPAFLEAMKNSKTGPKSSCPSPYEFMESFNGEHKYVYVVTISSKLSGSYNSALIAKDQYEDEHKNKTIHVFDSKSAVGGETLIALKIAELAKQYDHKIVVEKVNTFIKEMNTLFLLDSYENLIKNGRMNKFVGQIANALSIKPICRDNDGNIETLEKLRGSKKAFNRFIELIGEQGTNFNDRIVSICHCNCLDRALELKSAIEERYNFKQIVLSDVKGLNTVYAEEGGLVVAF